MNNKAKNSLDVYFLQSCKEISYSSKDNHLKL